MLLRRAALTDGPSALAIVMRELVRAVNTRVPLECPQSCAGFFLVSGPMYLHLAVRWPSGREGLVIVLVRDCGHSRGDQAGVVPQVTCGAICSCLEVPYVDFRALRQLINFQRSTAV